MGQLKIISDCSLNTRTAWCCDPYADSGDLLFPQGYPNQTSHDLRMLMLRAHQNGLEIAVHAIGDAAVHAAMDSFAVTGDHRSIQHAKLTRTQDIPPLAPRRRPGSGETPTLPAPRDA